MTRRMKGDALYGQGVVELGEDEIPPSATELLQSLGETFTSSKYRPPVLPRAATELLALSRDVETPVAKIVDLIQTDAMLAARVVSRANSAAFAANTPIRTLRDAVSRLGLARLRDIVVEAALSLRVFRAAAYQPIMERLAHHSARTAEIARVVCRYSTVDGELAFLSGLLHDIGVAGILIALAERPRGQQPDATLVRYALEQAHPTASERMAQLWQLPPELILVGRHHHELSVGRHVHPLCAVVVVAESEADQRDAGLADIDRGTPAALTRARAALDLDDRKYKLMQADLDKLAPRSAAAMAAAAQQRTSVGPGARAGGPGARPAAGPSGPGLAARDKAPVLGTRIR